MDGPVFFHIALGAIVAGFVQGLSGFAFSLVAISFWGVDCGAQARRGARGLWWA